ncbi:hypothetical protein HK097_007403 [Rhizophlyctis rosea]|uniref:Uncharacterized protein n=1 Tax=Rhizophlyctis rosea TaxID=64517 RepID=A0AAD5SJE3_9FUNG|nr:hypothetical protein HK097_007403 [Rhizophlyctis rosea]
MTSISDFDLFDEWVKSCDASEYVQFEPLEAVGANDNDSSPLRFGVAPEVGVDKPAGRRKEATPQPASSICGHLPTPLSTPVLSPPYMGSQSGFVAPSAEIDSLGVLVDSAGYWGAFPSPTMTLASTSSPFAAPSPFFPPVPIMDDTYNAWLTTVTHSEMDTLNYLNALLDTPTSSELQEFASSADVPAITFTDLLASATLPEKPTPPKAKFSRKLPNAPIIAPRKKEAPKKRKAALGPFTCDNCKKSFSRRCNLMVRSIPKSVTALHSFSDTENHKKKDALANA